LTDKNDTKATLVIPAKAGIQVLCTWIPAFAGMTVEKSVKMLECPKNEPETIYKMVQTRKIIFSRFQGKRALFFNIAPIRGFNSWPSFGRKPESRFFPGKKSA
jgi:hypothetical protein